VTRAFRLCDAVAVARADPERMALDEFTVLREFLDYHRDTLRMKVEGLTDAQAGCTPIPSTTLTLSGLVRHLALVEDHWFMRGFAGEAMPEPWASAPFDDDPDWEFHSATDRPLTESLALYAEACARSDAILDRLAIDPGPAAALDLPLAKPSRGVATSLRWVLVHMIEETARHNGHADLLREAIDGAIGD
jgi:uncharacterized damage-inducible protein DinB